MFLKQIFLFHIYLKHYQLLDFLWKDLLNSLAREIILCGCFRGKVRSQFLSLIDDSRQDKKKKLFHDILVSSFYWAPTYASHPLRELGAQGWRGCRRGPYSGSVCDVEKQWDEGAESRKKVRCGKDSFFQILRGHYQVPSSQKRDWYVLKHRGVKCHSGWMSQERGNLQIICPYKVWGWKSVTGNGAKESGQTSPTCQG